MRQGIGGEGGKEEGTFSKKALQPKGSNAFFSDEFATQML